MKGLFFTYFLTYGGAVAALFDPYIGLLIYVCFAIIKPESMWYWSVPAGNYSRIVAIALLIGWGLRSFGQLRFGAARPVVLALLGYFGWSAVSALFAFNTNLAWDSVESRAKIVLPFVAAVTLIDSLQKLKALAWVITLSQGYVAYEMNVFYYDGFNRVYQIGFGGMDNNCVAISMVTGVGLAFFLGLGETIWWRKLLAFTAAILMAHTIMFAYSRGGMLGLIITTFTAFFLVPKQPKHYAIFFVAVLIGYRLAGQGVVNRFMSSFVDAEERDASAQSRIVMWRRCQELMGQYPIAGVGPANFRRVNVQAGLPAIEAHTLWLQEGAELGIPGLGFLLAFYLICMRRLWKLRRDRPDLDPWLSFAARMVISSLVGFMVSAQFVSLPGLEVPYYVTLIGAGALKLAYMPQDALGGGLWNVRQPFLPQRIPICLTPLPH